MSYDLTSWILLPRQCRPCFPCWQKRGNIQAADRGLEGQEIVPTWQWWCSTLDWWWWLWWEGEDGGGGGSGVSGGSVGVAVSGDSSSVGGVGGLLLHWWSPSLNAERDIEAKKEGKILLSKVTIAFPDVPDSIMDWLVDWFQLINLIDWLNDFHPRCTLKIETKRCCLLLRMTYPWGWKQTWGENEIVFRGIVFVRLVQIIITNHQMHWFPTTANISQPLTSLSSS